MTAIPVELSEAGLFYRLDLRAVQFYKAYRVEIVQKKNLKEFTIKEPPKAADLTDATDWIWW